MKSRCFEMIKETGKVLQIRLRKKKVQITVEMKKGKKITSDLKKIIFHHKILILKTRQDG